MGWKKKAKRLRKAKKKARKLREARRKAEQQIGKKLSSKNNGPTYEGEGKDDPRAAAWANDL